MMSELLGQPAPDFIREAHNGQQVSLADFRCKDGLTSSIKLMPVPN
jgi:peroxiredoxin